MGHPTSFLPGEIEQMADQPAKKVRTAAQQAANQLGKNAAAWLAAKGLSKQIPYLAMVKKMKKEGASSPEIEAAVKAKINNNTRARVNKKAAPKNGTKKNNGAAAAAKANNATKKNNAAAKMRTPAQLAANAKMRNTAAAMKAAGIKFTPASFKNYKAAKLAGRSNDDVFAEFKSKYPAVNAEGKPIVAKRPATAKAPKAPTAAAAVAATANASAPVGSYVCDRCRLVTNTRKNNMSASMNNNSFRYF